jgi:hypothetical protein
LNSRSLDVEGVGVKNSLAERYFSVLDTAFFPHRADAAGLRIY